MPTAKAASSAIVIHDEGIFAVGGRNHNIAKKLTYTNQAQILQSIGNQKWTWLHLPSMLSERTMPGIAYFIGNVASHFDIEMMQMPPLGRSKPQWMFVSLMEFPRQHPYSSIVVNERLFLMRKCFAAFPFPLIIVITN